MKALLIKETSICGVIPILEKNGFKIDHYTKIEEIEPVLEKVLNPQETALIIIEATFLYNAFLRHQQNLPKIKEHHGKSAGFRFLQRNLNHFQDWIENDSVIILGFRNYKDHEEWANEMKVKFIPLREKYYLENQIKLAQKRWAIRQKKEETNA